MVSPLSPAVSTAADREGAPQRGVLFDVDGTLCDTNYIHSVCWAKAIWETEHKMVNMSTLQHHIGMGSDKFSEAVLGQHSDAATKAHSENYKTFYDDVRAFDGAAELLIELRDRGLDVVLASSADPEELEMLQGRIGAGDAIVAATSSGDADGSKPDPDIFQVALQKAGLEAPNALVVGDTVWDIMAARAAGMGCVGVLSGGIGRDLLVEAGALEVYSDVRELLDNLDDSALGRLWNAE